MRPLLVLIALCISCVLSATPLQDLSFKQAAVEDLAERLGLDPSGDLVRQTQTHWLRKSGQERWEIQELSLEQKEIVLHWAEVQGFFAENPPLDKNYDKAVILGGTTGRMQKRLDYLIQQWNLGLRFEQVVWLTGDRP